MVVCDDSYSGIVVESELLFFFPFVFFDLRLAEQA